MLLEMHGGLFPTICKLSPTGSWRLPDRKRCQKESPLAHEDLRACADTLLSICCVISVSPMGDRIRDLHPIRLPEKQ